MYVKRRSLTYYGQVSHTTPPLVVYSRRLTITSAVGGSVPAVGDNRQQLAIDN